MSKAWDKAQKRKKKEKKPKVDTPQIIPQLPIIKPFPCDKTDCRDYPEYNIMETTSRGRFFPYIVAICSYCEHMNKKDLYKKKNG